MRPSEREVQHLLAGWAGSIAAKVDCHELPELQHLRNQALENCIVTRSALARYIEVHPDQAEWLLSIIAETVPAMVPPAPTRYARVNVMGHIAYEGRTELVGRMFRVHAVGLNSACNEVVEGIVDVADRAVHSVEWMTEEQYNEWRSRLAWYVERKTEGYSGYIALPVLGEARYADKEEYELRPAPTGEMPKNEDGGVSG